MFYFIAGEKDAVSPGKRGTKVAAYYVLTIAPEGEDLYCQYFDTVSRFKTGNPPLLSHSFVNSCMDLPFTLFDSSCACIFPYR